MLQTLPCAVSFQSEREVESCLLRREEGKGESGRRELGKWEASAEQPGRAEMTV